MCRPPSRRKSKAPHPTPGPTHLVSNRTIPGSESYSFCESVIATSISPWCIRKLDETGRHLGGGITTPSLCGRVRPISREPRGLGGWDLGENVKITFGHTKACPRCLAELLRQLDLA